MASRVLEARGDVMGALCNSSTWQYAVIDLRTEPGRERLVIAYPDEKTLRDLLAAASIVALGYGSRQEAVEEIDVRMPKAVDSTGRLRPGLVDTNRKSLAESHAPKLRSADWCGLARTRTAFRHVVQQYAAAAIVFMYSKNVLSATVRAFIAF